MEAVAGARTAEELAMALERSGSTVQILQATLAGVIPTMIGCGACLVLSAGYLRRKREKGVHKALLCAVAVLSMSSCIVLAVNLRQLSTHIDSMADAYYGDSISLICTFFLTALATHLSRLLFIHRAYVLTSRRLLRVAPLLVTAHLALFSQVGLDIYGLTQPKWDARTAGAELDAVKSWWSALLGPRAKVQVVWGMVSFVCDLMICLSIIVALLRMRTFLDRTKGVINRFAMMITQTMLPPMVLSAIYAAVIISNTQGPGSWFRNIAALQAVFYWFAVVWTLRTRRDFAAMLDPPTLSPPIPQGAAIYTPGHSRPPTPRDTSHTLAECGGLSSTLVHGKGGEGLYDEKAGIGEAKLDVEIRRAQMTGSYQGLSEEARNLTRDEALRGREPELLYT
ncbi:uncharacterized protein MKK02DRAFT_37900 [Dioszegia hungarica]|uniref:Uncharacterized protein n=1 Tax=Dioszegia hungarica TaxID=4972 RepID=A0AA38H7L6_9TREE|nr:uncharacterized protein MKK02DRAFT_37900 [Dioszegia hungarica]KAI9634369.1 hypothetical protein MKK02DRAFT_37900 [Dioszegia hungarica]